MYRLKNTRTIIYITALSFLIFSSLSLNTVFAGYEKYQSDDVMEIQQLEGKLAELQKTKTPTHPAVVRAELKLNILKLRSALDKKNILYQSIKIIPKGSKWLPAESRNEDTILIRFMNITSQDKARVLLYNLSADYYVSSVEIVEEDGVTINQGYLYKKIPKLKNHVFHIPDILKKAKKPTKTTSKSQPKKKLSPSRKYLNIGRNYLRGNNGKTKNKQQAEHYFRKAADLGDKWGMLELSRIVSNNDERNNLLLKLVRKDFYMAMLDITNYHLTRNQKGRYGFDSNIGKAKYWYSRAENCRIKNKKHMATIKKRLDKFQLDVDQHNKTLRKIQNNNAKQERSYQREQQALRKAKQEYENEQKRLKKEKDRREWREADIAAEREAQGLRDLAQGIKRTGREIRHDLRHTQRDTARAYKHDKRTQRRNEEKARADYERKRKAILAESRRKQAELAKANARRDKKQPKEKWDCEKDWRSAKCGDRIVTAKINRLSPAYTGGRTTSGNTNSSSSRPGSTFRSTDTSQQKNSHSAGTSNSNKKQAMGKLLPEALAICKPKKSNPDLWWCDGPTQKLVLADDTLMKQLSYVGCGNANPQSHRVAAGKNRYIFFCQYGIQNHDRNIASIYSLAGNILVKRRGYQCKKGSTKKCTVLASP